MLIELTTALVGLALGAGAAFNWTRVRLKSRQAEMRRVAGAIANYFREGGIVAIAYCERLPDERIVALIEVEPNKRFRSSFVIEHTLRRHVQERSGISPDLVFWRFPLAQKSVEESALSAESPAARRPAAKGDGPAVAPTPPAEGPASANREPLRVGARAGGNVAFLESGSLPEAAGARQSAVMAPPKPQPRLASPVVSQMDFVQARSRATEYDIDEVPWEHFEQAARPEPDKVRETGS